MERAIGTAAPQGTSGRERAVVAGVSGAIILAQAIVFAAFGLLLLAMAADKGWSASESGFAYTLIIIGACIAAPVPIVLIRHIGGGGTIVLGQIVLAGSFLGLAFSDGLAQLYLGAIMAGVGFSLSGNSPGIYLISGWAGPRAAKLIGLYLMIGMFGNAVGPPGAEAAIRAGGWEGYCYLVTVLCVISAALCALALREPPASVGAVGSGQSWGKLGRVLRSPVFMLLAAGIVVTQLCLVTVASVAPAHLVSQGLSSAFAARLLGIEGLTGAVVTGALGYLTRILAPRWMLALSVLACAAGMLILAFSRDGLALHVFALLIGAGVGGALLSVTLLLVAYFGHAEGSASLGAVWTLAGLSALGPWISGMVADASGTYAPALAGIGICLLPIGAACLFLPREPRTEEPA